MQKVELTVVIAFGGVPDDVDLEELTVEGIPSTIQLLDGKGVISTAKYIGHETEDATGQDNFVVQE